MGVFLWKLSGSRLRSAIKAVYLFDQSWHSGSGQDAATKSAWSRARSSTRMGRRPCSSGSKSERFWQRGTPPAADKTGYGPFLGPGPSFRSQQLMPSIQRQTVALYAFAETPPPPARVTDRAVILSISRRKTILRLLGLVPRHFAF